MLKKTGLVLCALLLAGASIVGAKSADHSTASPILTQNITIGEASILSRVWHSATHFATLGFVQTSTTAIKQGEPFDVLFDHDGVDTTQYDLMVNTQLVASIPVASLLNGTGKFPFNAGMTKGTYTFVVVAVGPGGTGTSLPLTQSITAGNPSAPGQVRTIKQSGGGGN
jgi:hypothetical protein